MRAVLPALTKFSFSGSSDYMEDLVAQLDAPQLVDVQVALGWVDSLRVPQLFLLIAPTVILMFRHARVEFRNGNPTR